MEPRCDSASRANVPGATCVSLNVRAVHAVGLHFFVEASSFVINAFGVPTPELLLRLSVDDRVRPSILTFPSAESSAVASIVVRNEISSENGMRQSVVGAEPLISGIADVDGSPKTRGASLAFLNMMLAGFFINGSSDVEDVIGPLPCRSGIICELAAPSDAIAEALSP